MSKKPNVVLILIDDMGYRDLACAGSNFYETPNIDRLADEGVSFTNAYAACPVCSPSRASLLTGKYPAKIGVTDWIGAHSRGKLIDAPYTDHLPLSEDNLAHILKREGYNTYHVGKWHLGREEFYPQYQGFDVNIAGGHAGHPMNGYFSPYHLDNLTDGPDGEYLTDRITDEALSLISGQHDAPFFLFLAHYAVHTPIQAKTEDIRYFEQKAKRLGLDKTDPFVLCEEFPCCHMRGQHVTRRTLQSDPAYAAMIYNLDYNIGRVVEQLKKDNLYEDTVILFTSDNGGLATAQGSPTSNCPAAEGKGWIYDGGLRVPLLISHPKMAVKQKVHTPTTTPDILPTILDLCGSAAAPKDIDGISMLPAMRGENTPEREEIFWHYPHYGDQGGTPAAAVRKGNFKLIRFFEDEHIELYNLKEDVSESVNLAPDSPHIAQNLLTLLNDWIESACGILPLPNPDYSEA